MRRQHLLSGLFLLISTMVMGAEEFELIKDGKAVPIYATSEKAAEPLKDFISILKRGGVSTLPEIAKTKPEIAHLFFRVNPENNPRKLDNFSFHFEEGTMIVDCTEVSLQWALNRILEDYAGVKQLMPEECGLEIPAISEIVIPAEDKEFAPSFFSRSIYFSTDEWHKRNQFSDGVHFNHELYINTFPMHRYDAEGFPEGILPQHNGKRLSALPNRSRPAQYWQPCFSNQKSVDYAVENIVEYLRANPATTSISLTINDNGGFCECDDCAQANGGRKHYNHSEVYFKWVNQVAEKVGKEFPDVLLCALAYAEVLPVPSIRLSDNVAVIICLDLYATTDPAIMEKNSKLISDWSEHASTLGCWDYAWGYFYVLPRIYLQKQVEMMRKLHAANAGIYFLEYESMDGREGPKPYLYAKLLWDINADATAIEEQWYVDCVGAKAAPHLKRYFHLLEAYFAGEEVRKTPWFGSAKYVYMTWGATNHLYGLLPGQLREFRQAMEQVVAQAETPTQKARAEILMRRFEITEALSVLNCAEPMPSDGVIKNAEEAVAVIENLNQAPHYIDQLKRAAAETKQEPVIGTRMAESTMGSLLNAEPDGIMIGILCNAARFRNEPAVAEALKKLAANAKLPEAVRKSAELFSATSLLENNLFPEGDFNAGNPNVVKASGSGKDSLEVVSFEGNQMLSVKPGVQTTIERIFTAKPNSGYLLTLRVFIPECGPEAYLRGTVFCAKDGEVFEWYEVSKVFVPEGRYVEFAFYGQTFETANELHFTFELGNFDPGQVVLVDDLAQNFVFTVSKQ